MVMTGGNPGMEPVKPGALGRGAMWFILGLKKAYKKD